MFRQSGNYNVEKAQQSYDSAFLNGLSGHGHYGKNNRNEQRHLASRQKKLPVQSGVTKKQAIQDAKEYGQIAWDIRSDILGLVADSTDATKDVIGLLSGDNGLYTSGDFEFSYGSYIGAAKLIHDTAFSVYDWYKGNKSPSSLEANPLLSTIDQALNNNAKTAAYLKKRMVKNIAGDAVSYAGGVLSSGTHVNALGAVRHGRADTKTGVHLFRLKKLLNKFKGQGLGLECELCEVIIKCKQLKLEAQSVGFAMDMIPGNVVTGSATSVIGFLHGVSLAERLKDLSPAIIAAAQRLHYRAFYELDDDYGLAGLFDEEIEWEKCHDTPALDMVREIFSQAAKIEKEKVLFNVRGHKFKIGGEHYKADKLMREPAGWLAIVDKLELL
ncbi:hypothetical protein [Veronia pacifica]|uniref:Uncharacterized protein n=1 Tax=Veronia pacifica TaxID=1080227 RepID=A0A1C3EDP6_9GAMM|nr:hypothetical protein [Veronia pacifica]ODA31376.1 hypothetical protein A8L45_17460 [Veronia pacifica]